jgi:hypothetical protein
MATENILSNKMVDTAIGAMSVQDSEVTGVDIDDFVSTTVSGIALTLRMYNKAVNVNTSFAANRRKVSIGGVTVGGY